VVVLRHGDGPPAIYFLELDGAAEDAGQGRRGVGVDLGLVAGRVVAVVLAREDVEADGWAAGRPLRFSSAGDSKARGENGRMGRWGGMGRGQPALRSFRKKCRAGWLRGEDAECSLLSEQYLLCISLV
jgi:hypothetical protein